MHVPRNSGRDISSNLITCITTITTTTYYYYRSYCHYMHVHVVDNQVGRRANHIILNPCLHYLSLHVP